MADAAADGQALPSQQSRPVLTHLSNRVPQLSAPASTRTAMTTPGSPSRHATGAATAERDRILNDLSVRWGLVIQPPKDGESPSRRLEKLAVGRKAETYPTECFFKINFLCLKDQSALSTALNTFEYAATALQSGWVSKPNADDDLLPRSPRSKPLVTAAHLEELFQCLLRFITPVFEQAKERESKRSATLREIKPLGDVPYPIFTPQHVFERLVVDEALDDTPIPFRLGAGGRGKRRSDGDEEINDVSKRTKGPPDDSDSQKIIAALDSVQVVTRPGGSDTWSSITRPLPFGCTDSFPAAAFKVPDIPRNMASDDRIQPRQVKQPETANTSFTSNASVFSSVFDDDMSDASEESFFSTQTSVMDTSSDRRGIQERNPLAKKEDAQCGSSIDDFEMIDPPSFTSESLLLERLQSVFPALPAFLQDAPLAIRYEIMRVCTHAKVPMTDLYFPISDFSNLRDYDSFWSILRAQPALKGKDFPEKSDPDAWTSSLDKFHKGFHGVILSAKLKFSNSQEGPFFTFQLQPLKTEVSHRLSRRFGNDRFLEMSIPSFSGNKLPKLLKDAKQSGRGDACRKVIVEWMTLEEHKFLGVTWGSFYLKDGTKKRRKLKLSVDEEVDNHPTYTNYLFATDGVGFQASKTLPPKGESPNRHTKMTVAAMVNWLIPLEENKQEKALKLFARIALGLSKTWKTVELDPSEIIYVPDDLRSKETGEVMNDGCGRLSFKMAMNIVECLGLSHIPSGFQARIGGAKGFWIVDVNYKREEQWIEIYPSQMKWKRSPEVMDLANHEVDHRTFEVVDWAKPLKSAALNLQLIPLLEDRGNNREAMRGSISSLLVNGLNHEIQMQRAAMESPQAFRKWVRDNNSGVEERIKHCQVPYVAGLPRSLEEQLNLLLDAGFDPQKLRFLKDLAWKAYTQKCAVLKEKLNIKVGRSTYAYMAVDFAGILEPDEVHLCFSNCFTDEASKFYENELDGIDILVARCPAHYISDIQKVKAVWKRELKHLKDIIVFSSNGNFPLAKKLSGGDYDGDMAWACFEPTIVSDFINADVPDCPNLVELDYIQKDRTTYSDISLNDNPVVAFLQYCFNFNLQDNLLGICTNHKEWLCYTTNNVGNHEAVFLSTLLSELVDQRKQGYTFNMQSWEKVKNEVIKVKVREPQYKRAKFDGGRQPEHIIDYLKFFVAERTIQETLKDFHQSLTMRAYWDDDVVKLAQWARERAKEAPEWKSLVDQLECDLKAVRKAWTGHFSRKPNPESMANFTSVVTSLHDQWHAIAPAPDNPLSPALAPPCLPSLELSTFSLLKASLGFSLGTRRCGSNFIWWMAGRQVAALKALYGRDGGRAAVVAPPMYAMLRPDSTFVKLMQSQDHDPRFWEAKAESVVPDEEMGSEAWDEEMGG